jgi:hypothetical protein
MIPNEYDSNQSGIQELIQSDNVAISRRSDTIIIGTCLIMLSGLNSCHEIYEVVFYVRILEFHLLSLIEYVEAGLEGQ